MIVDVERSVLDRLCYNAQNLGITREMHMQAVTYCIMHRTCNRDVLGRR